MEYEGLIFLKNSENGCTLDRVGTYNDVDLVIPPVLEGLPVTRVEDHALQPCSSLKSVKFPDTLVGIGDYSFSGCSLTELEFPASLGYIGEGAFRGCESLKRVTFSSGTTYIASSAFKDCISLMSVVIPEGVTAIKTATFLHCWNLRYVSIPDSVETIEEWAFWHCFKLGSVTIGKGIKKIEKGAFKKCERLSHVFYSGNKAEWKRVYVDRTDGGNDALNPGTLCFYSEKAPGEDGRYWHYDYDGVPSVWE